MIWCLAGEGAMPYYLSKTQREDVATQKQGWTEVAKYVHSIDPYHHAVTIHPTKAATRWKTRPCSISTCCKPVTATARAFPTRRIWSPARCCRDPRMPVLAGEVCYEGIMEASRQEIQRFMFWTCILNGAGGHTYGANGIWQVNTREQPFGPSPHGRSWGDVPWDVAARTPRLAAHRAWARGC